jgi:hypothetical protein
VTDDPKHDLGRGGGVAGRRVVARGVRRKEIDHRLLIQALLMIAKDLEREDEAESGGEKEG